MRTDLYFCSDRKVSSRVAATIVLAAILFSCSPTSADDWGILFNGKTLDGWKPFRDTTQFALSDGVVVATSSADTQFLHTVEEYGDFELQLEVKLHDTDLNSGVQIRTHLTRTSDDGKVRPRLHGPQVDIGKSPGRSGYIFNQGNGAWITPEEDLVRSDAMKNGKWNKLRVLAIGPRIQTWINDEQVGDVANDEAYKKYPSGVIALQVHGVKRSPEKARHVSFRSIRIRKIESAK